MKKIKWGRTTEIQKEIGSVCEDVEKEKKKPYVLLVGMKIGAVTLEDSVEVPQKIKN